MLLSLWIVLYQIDLYFWPWVLNTDALMEIIKKVTTNPAIPANLLTSIRAVTNLFKNSCYYNWLQKNRSEVGIPFCIVIFWVWPPVPSIGLSFECGFEHCVLSVHSGGCRFLSTSMILIYGCDIVADKHLMRSTSYCFHLCILYY